MEQKRRVVITGMGVITPIGNSIGEFRDSIFEGRCGISPLVGDGSRDFDGINVRVAGQVLDFDPLSFGLSPQEVRRNDRYAQFAMAAAARAVEMSGLKVGENIEPEMLGVYIGSGVGGLETFVRQTKNMSENGGGRVSPLFIPMMIANIAGANVAIRCNAQGPALTCVAACATGTNAVGEAFLAVARGDAEAIIAGGSDATLNPLAVGGFQSARALSLEEDPLKACLPFDARRSGFVIAEGAGVLVLEEYQHAKARGAEMIAEVVGYGNTCDAHHVTAPSPDGKSAARAIRRALQMGGYRSGEALYINAHGTGTHLNDSSETAAIRLALGPDADRAMVSSTKSMTAHALGAAGAIELVASALALRHGIVPPTIGLREPDPACDLDYVPLEARRADIDIAISNSLGFGGHNAVVALRKIL